MTKKHKNALDTPHPQRLAFHPQRGVKIVLGELKPGWSWVIDAEALPTPKPLPKPRVRARPIKS